MALFSRVYGSFKMSSYALILVVLRIIDPFTDPRLDHDRNYLLGHDPRPISL
jgi:hypothetical protein